MQEYYAFEEDSAPNLSTSEKNAELSQLIATSYLMENIVSIKRIEIGQKKGWEITYRA